MMKMLHERLMDVEDWGARARHIEKLRKATEGFLRSPEKAQLIEICKELWSISSVFRKRDQKWYVENRILEKTKVNEVAESMRYLLYGEEPIEERLRVKIPGMGLSTLTEILFAFYPEKYPIYNKRSEKSLEKLGYTLSRPKNSPERYVEFMQLCNDIANSLEPLKKSTEKKLKLKIPKFDFTDKIFSDIYENKISIDVIKKNLTKQMIKVKDIEDAVFNYALGSLQGAIKQYFYWLERGDPDDLAITKAVNYACGMISSSGVLKNGEQREKFKYSLKAIRNLSQGILKIIEEVERSGLI